MRTSVVIPTHHRVPTLSACLEGLRAQTQPPDEIIVVVHHQDAGSAEHVTSESARWPELRAVTLYQEGLVAACNCGLRAARGDIVAYLDDDSVPEPGWLKQIVSTFESDPRIAAVGGRDMIVGRDDLRPGRFDRIGRQLRVGEIQWFGRMITNHHLGIGPARDVDVLKGVNMSFRREEVIPLGFDSRLRGHGAQLHSEPSVCLPLRRRGLRVIYDPAILVKHYPAARPAGNERGRITVDEVYIAAYNEALSIFDYLGPTRGMVFAMWGLLVGSSGAPGVIVLLRELLNRSPMPLARLVAAQRGRFDAWRTCGRVPRQIGVA